MRSMTFLRSQPETSDKAVKICVQEFPDRTGTILLSKVLVVNPTHVMLMTISVTIAT